MKLVYIASPYAGDIEKNTAAAIRYCKYAVKMGVIPIAPHLLFTRFLNDTVPAERKLGMGLGLELLHHCDELWVFGDKISEGMRMEINYVQTEMPRQHMRRTIVFISEDEVTACLEKKRGGAECR